MLERTVDFFWEYQRFDDGDFKTPRDFPYFANKSCYGKHTCYWGVTRLLKGISFIPRSERSARAQQLIERCIEFVLQHEVCFGSRHTERLLHRDIGMLTFPNFYKSDLLEILWLLQREGVRDRRMQRALEAAALEDEGWRGLGDGKISQHHRTHRAGRQRQRLHHGAGAAGAEPVKVCAARKLPHTPFSSSADPEVTQTGLAQPGAARRFSAS